MREEPGFAPEEIQAAKASFIEITHSLENISLAYFARPRIKFTADQADASPQFERRRRALFYL